MDGGRSRITDREAAPGIAATSTRNAWPGPGLRESLGALRASGGDYLRLIEALQRRHGDLFRIPLGVTSLYVVAGPSGVDEVLKAPHDVFLKNELITREMKSLGPESVAVTDGDTWKRHRRLMSPPFTRSHLPDHDADITMALGSWKKGWNDALEQGRILEGETAGIQSADDNKDGAGIELPVRIEEATADFAFEVITRMMLGRPVPEIERTIREGLEEELRCLTRRLTSPLPLPGWLPTSNQRRLWRAQRSLDTSVHGLVDRVAEGKTTGFAHAWWQSYLANEADPQRAKSLLRDQLMSILTAGHQTASFGLAYVLHQVAAYPEVARALTEESDRILAGRSPRAADLASLPLSDRVVRETLRLFPVLPVVVRRASKPFAVGGQVLPAGANVAISLWSAHRHPEHWPEAERFDPDRFLPERSVGRHPGAWAPFSLGARNCMAGDFATFEMRMALVDIVQHFVLGLDPAHKLEVAPQLALAPTNGVRLLVRPRRRPSAS